MGIFRRRGSLHQRAFTSRRSPFPLSPTHPGTPRWFLQVWQGFILTSFNVVIATATEIFATESVVPRITGLAGTVSLSAKQASVLAVPVGATYANLAPLPIGVSVVINTGA